MRVTPTTDANQELPAVTCVNLDPAEEWKNASIEPVPAYAARSEASAIRRWVESGETFRPSARCGTWLQVFPLNSREPVYVLVSAVERTQPSLEAGEW